MKYVRHSKILFAALTLTTLLVGSQIAPHFAARADTKSTKTGNRRRGPVTFNKDIAPIVFQQCVSCHRPNEVAPFSLLTYHDAEKRAKQIAIVTAKCVMPPWQPEAGYGAFQHERRLTAVQIAAFQEWAEAGAPEGNAKDLPPVPQFPDGWQLGKPDMIIKMPKAFPIPASGSDVNRSFPVSLHLPADRYIRAAEFHPGNRRLVHHATLMLDNSGKARELEAKQGGPGSGYVSFGGAGISSGRRTARLCARYAAGGIPR